MAYVDLVFQFRCQVQTQPVQEESAPQGLITHACDNPYTPESSRFQRCQKQYLNY